MKKGPNKKYKKEINIICRKLRWEFYLNEYTMHVCFADEPKEDSPNCAAEIDADYRYLEFTLTLYPMVEKWWHKGEWHSIKRTLVHEFSHALIDPLYLALRQYIPPGAIPHITDIRERQTQRICNLIEMYLPKRVWEVKKKKHAAK